MLAERYLKRATRGGTLTIEKAVQISRKYRAMIDPTYDPAEEQAEIDRQRAIAKLLHEQQMATHAAYLEASKTGVGMAEAQRAKFDAQLQYFGYPPGTIPLVRIIAWAPKCTRLCDACRELANQVFDINAEIAAPHLPPKGCTCESISGLPGACMCFYEAEFND